MTRSENFILDFTHIYIDENIEQTENIVRIDCSDILETDLYCTKEGEAEIQKRIENFSINGVHFIDSGNYHYTMPNTPALVGEGMTGVCANDLVTEEELQLVLTLLKSFGRAEVVPEYLMDTVTGVSGSSPAYVFLFLEALADAAVAEGMPRKQAYEFAAQSVLGSAKMLLETGMHPGELKDMVCSPGGTTIEAVAVLEREKLRSAVIDATRACIRKSKGVD